MTDMPTIAGRDAVLDIFEHGVNLIGGQRATARQLGIHERTVRMLLAGDRTLHAGMVADIADQLDRHASECIRIAAQLRDVAVHLPVRRKKTGD